MNKILLLTLFLISFTSSLQSLTLSDIRTEVRRNINDNSSSSTRYRYSDAVLLDLINRTQREIVNVTWLSEKTSSYILSANTTFYNLPSDLIAIKKVEIRDEDDNITELKETSIGELYNNNIEWKTETGDPFEYYISQIDLSTPTSSNLNISYIPIPTNTSTGTVTIQYYDQVIDLSTSTDIPFNSKKHLYPYHQSIIYGVTAAIKFMEMKLNEGQFYYQLYTNEIKIIRDRINSMPNYSPSMIIGK